MNNSPPNNHDNHSNSESSYLALARKYRPSNFAELIGQETLVTTLSNAINKQRLHHAYILTGIRGVGKTTTARIIAKSFNCLGVVNDLSEFVVIDSVPSNCNDFENKFKSILKNLDSELINKSLLEKNFEILVKIE